MLSNFIYLYYISPHVHMCMCLHMCTCSTLDVSKYLSKLSFNLTLMLFIGMSSNYLFSNWNEKFHRNSVLVTLKTV